jgi:hypothetical protein
VDKFFKTFAKLEFGVDRYLQSPNRKPLAKNIERVNEREKNTSEFVFLLAKPEFYSHLASGNPQPCL